jgi:hypothetical protein
MEQPGMTPESTKNTTAVTPRMTAEPVAARRFLIAEKHLRFARAQPARTHDSDRRHFARVPFSGALRWQSGGRSGTAEVLDLSEAGAAFAVPQREAVHFDGELSLDIAFGPDVIWQVTRGAHVTRILPRDAETCRVCVKFPPEQRNEAP